MTIKTQSQTHPQNPHNPHHFLLAVITVVLNNTKQYDNHVVMRHSGKPGYPGQADIKALNLKPQGMSWEV